MTDTVATLAPQGVSQIATAIAAATAVAGVLDIGDAVVVSVVSGRSPAKMLQGIASGLMGKDASQGGLAAAGLGLGLHFAIMLVMAAVFVLAATRLPDLARRPILWGPIYGICLYLIMYWVVLPLRWPPLWGKFEPVSFANQIFAHTCLVGLPIALIAAWILRPPPV